MQRGLRLELPLLRDPGMTLVKNMPRRRQDHFVLGHRRGGRLHDLERDIKVVQS